VRCTEPAEPALLANPADPADPADIRRRLLALVPALLGTSWLAGCGTPPPAVAGAPPSPPTPAVRDPAKAVPPSAASGPAPAPPAAAPPAHAGVPQATAPVPALPLPPPVAARNWEEFRLQAARRLVAANPGRVYTGPVPEPLLAIPVLEVELNADGGVRAIRVLRTPTQARDTIELARAAVQRAAPFGAMSRLPRPWKFVEVFLFDDQRRFKPRTLDR
jgi:hypothetical protein